MATHRICSIPDCGKPHLAKGLCSAHYQRERQHGDPLGGGTTIGEPMRFFVEEVLSHDGNECLIWPFGKNTRGYATLFYDGKKRLTHRVLCELTKGAPPTPKHEAAHSCGRGHLGCVNKHHLSWKTHIANMEDTLIHGTDSQGERHGMAKLTVERVIRIRALKGRMSQAQIAREFNVSDATINMVLSRKRWPSVS